MRKNARLRVNAIRSKSKISRDLVRQRRVEDGFLDSNKFYGMKRDEAKKFSASGLNISVVSLKNAERPTSGKKARGVDEQPEIRESGKGAEKKELQSGWKNEKMFVREGETGMLHLQRGPHGPDLTCMLHWPDLTVEVYPMVGFNEEVTVSKDWELPGEAETQQRGQL